MAFPISLFRSVAEASPLFQTVFLTVFVAVFVMHHSLSLPLRKFPDGLNLPDKRFGYTPSELNAWYDAIGTEGCLVYIRATTVDFLPVMPTYCVFLGSLLVFLADKSKSPRQVQLAYLPVVTVFFDIIETYVQRRGCMIYPERLTDAVIQFGSLGNLGKWICLISSILLIVFLGGYVVLIQSSNDRKKKQN